MEAEEQSGGGQMAGAERSGGAFPGVRNCPSKDEFLNGSHSPHLARSVLLDLTKLQSQTFWLQAPDQHWISVLEENTVRLNIFCCYGTQVYKKRLKVIRITAMRDSSRWYHVIRVQPNRGRPQLYRLYIRGPFGLFISTINSPATICNSRILQPVNNRSIHSEKLYNI